MGHVTLTMPARSHLSSQGYNFTYSIWRLQPF